MNEAKFEEFSKAYAASLTEAVEMFPKEFDYPVEKVPEVVAKMLKAIRENPRQVQYTKSIGVKKACLKLGIKYSVKSIMAYLEVV